MLKCYRRKGVIMNEVNPNNNISNNEGNYNKELNSTYMNNTNITSDVKTKRFNVLKMNNDDLMKIFIGKNCDKILNKSFNFSGFFFTTLYMFYRKMFLYGLIAFLLNFLLFNLIDNFIIKLLFMLIFNLLVGFFVNKIYMLFVERKIDKIKINNFRSSPEEINYICAKKGGTSIGKIFLGLFIEIIISIIIVITMFFVGIFNLFNNLCPINILHNLCEINKVEKPGNSGERKEIQVKIIK